MDLAPARILTGGVARLAGSCEKPAGVLEGRKEGRKQ
jgi:hypothetical protein